MGLILIGGRMIFLLGLIVLVCDFFFVYLAVKSFQRERILTQWK
jgi:hypothetical protein